MSSTHLIESYLNDQLPRPVSLAHLFEDAEVWKETALTESTGSFIDRAIPSVSEITNKVRDVSEDVVGGIRGFISGFFTKLFESFKKSGKVVWRNLPSLNIRFSPPAKLVITAVMPRNSDLDYSLHVDLYVDLIERRVDIEVSGHIGKHIDFSISKFRAYEADQEDPEDYVRDVEKSVDRADTVVVPKYAEEYTDDDYDRQGGSPFALLPA